MNTNTAFKYEDVYKAMDEVAGQNPILLQSFVLNNNADIIKAIEYFKTKHAKASEVEKIEIQNNIDRLENLMVQRLLVTEDLFAKSMPLRPAGPQQITENQEEVKEEKKEEKEVKTLEHPASKGKKKQQTVNEKLGKQVAEKKKDEKKVESKPVENTFKTDYDKLYPTDKEKIEAINKILPSIEEKVKNGKRDAALRQLKFHLKSYGEELKHFATMEQMNLILDWLKSGEFQARSPFDVMEGKPITIMAIIAQVESMIIEGKTRKEIRNFLSTHIIDQKIEGWEKTISTERGYVEFFQRTLQYLFDEDNLRKLTAQNSEDEDTEETRESIKKNLYDIHKDAKNSVYTAARQFKEWVISKGKEIDLKTALAEMLEYVKSSDPNAYRAYLKKKNARKKESSGGNKTETKKVESKEESKEPDVEKSKSDKPTSPTKYPKLEDMLKYKEKKSLLTEYLLTIMNKRLVPIGDMKNGIDKKIEALTTLAKKRMLEMGCELEEGKNTDDWTENDVLHYMAQEIVPYCTDEYGILNSNDEEDVKSHLEFYLEKYPAGEEKARKEKLMEVFTSEIPRSRFMKGVARRFKKNQDEINGWIKDINQIVLDKLKEEKTKTK